MREKDIEYAVTQYAKKLGWLSYKFVSPSNRGVPDRLYIKDGSVIFIEFKAPGKKPTKLQKSIHRKMEEHGAIVQVVGSVEKGKDIFENITNYIHIPYVDFPDPERLT